MTAEEKQREEEKRDRMYDPVLRWKHIQDAITWAEASMPEHLRRNRPRMPKALRPSTPVLLATALLIAFAPLSRAEDWKTIDGKVYQDVKILNVEPDAITILHKDGGALIPLEMLPDEIQKRFHYDPEKAKAAADARMQREIADARALREERAALADRRQAEDDDEAARDAGSSGDNSRQDVSSVDSNSSHHSMGELFSSASSLQRDLGDPTYHTMSHLAIEARSLQPAPNDPNHHTIGEATNPSP